MAPAPPRSSISRVAILRGVLCVILGVGAFVAGVTDEWTAALGLFIAAVVVAPSAWITGGWLDEGSGGAGGTFGDGGC